MEKFTVLNGLVAPLDRANVDTDQIIPKQYLASIKKTGFGEGLFADWRKKDPQFVLNQSRRDDPLGAEKLRLRLLARACAMGACRLWFSLRDRACTGRCIARDV